MEIYQANMVDIKPHQIINCDNNANDDFYGFVYVITCLENNKQYVGLTYRPVIKRWKEHVYHADSESNKQLYKDMSEYGVEQFKFEVLYQAPASMISQLEKETISAMGSYEDGYNSTSGGSYVPGINGPVLTRPAKEDLIEALIPRGKSGAMTIFHTDIHTITSWISSYGIEDKWSCVLRGHRLPDDEKPTKEDLKAMIEDMSVTQIGAVYGLEPSTIRYYLKKFDIVNPRSNNKKTGKKLENEPSKKEIQDLVNKGKNASEIGRHFGISARTMRKIMKRKDIENPFSKNTGNKAKSHPSKAELEKLLETHLLKEIGEMYGVSAGAVKYWIQIYNIDFKSPYDHQSDKNKNELNNYSKEELELLLAKWHTIDQVAKELSVSEGTLYTLYRKRGIQLAPTLMSTMFDII